ncbi:hormogonium polysaccharide biosynthesis glycosyltransferase HpsE [Phormidium pseudopriestleyi FRX01]|uniref:Hormogonium polysaccharide biosynthesis glycosyltransferase HpsE n=1 Tax=Phormidium pseudopriestleyi FRX01 TaxID=1759528 RepID=A0ABS3FMU9_9CYAN|nr:hormogonium polysaccharide biosynthesis glycosyltransferase HpsE [Phormidium pseudopriestleyi]MBO0348439.1 hormogonium polysaccharide biosynthesis glycosyltransferase HpsE [Phormidium pseudopriestleyi FRX01]
MNTVDLTVAIPTYNGETRLSDVLDRLRSQVGTEEFSWEIIVVDNNSSDRTAALVRKYQETWPSAYPLRYCFAPEQGAAFARQRAVEKAQGELIGFLDDDNLPEPDWVAAAYQFGKIHPEVGAFGSQIHGLFYEKNAEDKLPTNFKRIACFLAIVERGNSPRLYDPKHKILPPGAGLVVRKKVWLESVPNRLVLNHTGKEAGLASEDLEVLLHIQKAGWEIWYNPAMVVYHKIPNKRLEPEYLKLLVRCVGLSRHRLRMMTLNSWQRPLAFPAYLANDLRRLVLHGIRHGIAIKDDTAATCEREFLTSTLMSPLFLLKHQGFKSAETSSDRPSEIPNQTSLEELTEAFEEQRFRLHSQGVYPLNAKAGDRPHTEILLRLEDPDGELLLPNQFMPVAKRYNLMRTIDRWTIRKLCSQIAEAGDPFPEGLYEINLSESSLCDRYLIDFLVQELAFYKIPPELLCFCIPETVAISHLPRLQELIDRLQSIGCQLSLDGVGAVQSSGDYLQKLSVNYLKLEGNLIQSIDENLDSLNKVKAFHQLGQTLGIKTIASHVENLGILEQTQRIGVNYVQGYEIERPKPLSFELNMTTNWVPKLLKLEISIPSELSPAPLSSLAGLLSETSLESPVAL